MTLRKYQYKTCALRTTSYPTLFEGQATTAGRQKDLNVVGMDTGTWPMDGGGVASCRELVLDYVEDINWKVNAEIGNDYKQARSANDAKTVMGHLFWILARDTSTRS